MCMSTKANSLIIHGNCISKRATFGERWCWKYTGLPATQPTLQRAIVFWEGIIHDRYISEWATFVRGRSQWRIEAEAHLLTVPSIMVAKVRVSLMWQYLLYDLSQWLMGLVPLCSHRYYIMSSMYHHNADMHQEQPTATPTMIPHLP